MALRRIEMQLLELTVGLNAHRDQQGEPLPVRRRAAILPRIFPVQVQPIKLVGTEEADGRLDEGGAALGPGDHGDESGGTQEKKISVESAFFVRREDGSVRRTRRQLTGSIH